MKTKLKEYKFKLMPKGMFGTAISGDITAEGAAQASNSVFTRVPRMHSRDLGSPPFGPNSAFYDRGSPEVEYSLELYCKVDAEEEVNKEKAADNLRLQVEALKCEAADLERRNDALGTGIRLGNAANTSLVHQVEALNTQLITHSHTHQNKTVRCLRRQLDSSESRCLQVIDAHEATKHELEATKEQLRVKNDLLDNTQRALRQATEEVNKRGQEMKGLRKQVDSLTHKLAAAKEEVKVNTVSLVSTQNHVAHLKAELTNQKDINAVTHRTLIESRAVIGELVEQGVLRVS